MNRAQALEQPVLLFSGLCRLCRWGARIVSWIDRRHELALLPLEHREADALLSSISEEGRADSWWIVLRDGSPIRGDRSGALMLLVALWLARPVGRVPRHLRVSSFLDTLHEALTKERAERAAGPVRGGGTRSAPGLPPARARERIGSQAG
jgi:predicted DCC family thiol-disulfide oxidoreductase YuxK